MPTPIYMYINAEVKGEVSNGALSPESVGGLSKADKVNFIQVVQLESNHEIPVDPQAKRPSGRRIHHGFTIHKYIDKSSPDLYGIWAKGIEMPTIRLDFWRIPKSGQEELYYKITAEQCTLTGIRTYFPNALDPAFKHMGHMEAVTFSYRRVTWLHVICGTTDQDDFDT